ncbi:MAG: hypothetical protein ACHP9T_14360 [Caulobacterales bacterium]
MAANHASIKLSTAFVDEARKEAEVLHRSVGAQVEHWAKLGRAYENTPGVSVNQVRAALARGRKLEDMTAEERDAFYDDLGDFFAKPDRAMTDFYAALGTEDGGAPSDGKGGMARRTASGRPRRIA